MKRKILLIVAAVLIYSGCSSTSETKDYQISPGGNMPAGNVPVSESYYTESQYAEGEYIDEERVVEDQGSSKLVPGEDFGEKIIKNYSLSLETREYNDYTKAIANKAKELGGFIESSNLDNYGDSRLGWFYYRIPADKAEVFVDFVKEGASTIQNESMSTNDSTKYYRDNETRIKVLEEKETRLRELLTKAETVEEIVIVENTLADTIAEKEIYIQENKSIDDRVSYSSVDLGIREVATVSTPIKDSFGSRIEDALGKSFVNFILMIQGAIIYLIYLFPPLILILLLVLIIRWAIRKYRARTAGKKSGLGGFDEKTARETIRDKVNLSKKDKDVDEKDNEIR